MSKRYALEVPDWENGIYRWEDISEQGAPSMFTYHSGTQNFYTEVNDEEVEVQDVESLQMARKMVQVFGFTIVEEIN